MKLKCIQLISLMVLLLSVISCSKYSELWHQDTHVEKARILGTLVHEETNQPLAGLKVIFERQTKSDGTNTFIDTVSTNDQGKFMYEVPVDNKVRVVLRDTGRYEADTVYVQVSDVKDYDITLKSQPRFGVMPVGVYVHDTFNDVALQAVNVSLLVRESNNESFSLVETRETDEEGKVTFDNIAWPVNYKVRIEEDKNRYELDSLSGRITKKDPLNLNLKSSLLYGDATALTIKTVIKGNPSQSVSNVEIIVKHKQDGTDQYVTIDDLVTNSNGTVETMVAYPSDVEISIKDNGSYFPATSELRVTRAGASTILEVDAIPLETWAKIKVMEQGTTAFMPGFPVNVYQSNPGANNYSLIGTYISDSQGNITVENIKYPKDIKIENKYSLGAYSKQENIVNVPSYHPIEVDFTPPESNRYQLFGNGDHDNSAILKYAELGIYNDPTIFGANVNQELTFHIKVKLNTKGGNNPAIGGTVSHYNANNGLNNFGYGFMHSGHGTDFPNWRFKFGKTMVTSTGQILPGGEWVSMTAVITKNGSSRTVKLYTNGIQDVTAALASDRTGVVTNNSLILGNGPNQFGAGHNSNYLKDFRIYRRALSQAEINAISCKDFEATNDPDLIGYWPMNEGTGNTLKNLAPISEAAGKDLIINNAKPFTKLNRKCD